MRPLRALVARLRGLVGRRAADAELAAEFESHLRLHIDDNIRAGMTPAEARRVALLKFGGIASATEAYRDRRGLPGVDSWLQDVRYGVRLLRRSPSFTIVAVLSLALGIGANTAIFSIVNGLMLRRLPVERPDLLVRVRPGPDQPTWSYPLWETLRARTDLVGRATAFTEWTPNIADRGEVQTARVILGSGGFFETLGVRPALGQVFTDVHDAPGGGPEGPVAVISDSFWKTRFAAAPDAIGRTVSIERVPFTVIGVMPPAFHGPSIGATFDLIVPLNAGRLIRGNARIFDDRISWWLQVLMRLRPDQTIEQATVALAAAAPAMRDAAMPPRYSAEERERFRQRVPRLFAAPGGVSYVRAYETPVLVLMSVVGLVLLISCANIANLLLARASTRRQEISVRLALGAPRRRLVRQLMIESLLLSLSGAAAGLFMARWASALLVRQLSTQSNPIVVDVSIDWLVLGFTAAVAVTVALLFGLVPALRAARVSAHDVVAGSPRIVRGEARLSTSSALVVSQVALSLVLVVGAAQFVRTFTALAAAPLGFDRDAVLTVAIGGRRSTTPLESRRDLFLRVRDAVAALPGVESAALSVVTPVSGSTWSTSIENPPGLESPDPDPSSFVHVVSPGWIRTYGLSLVAGRNLSDDDTTTSEQVVLVNQALVRRYFPNTSPIGQLLVETNGAANPKTPRRIVGVVSDAVYQSIRDGVPPTMFRPLPQSAPQPSITLGVRAAPGRALALAPSISAAVAAIDPDLSLTFRLLGDYIDASITTERVVAQLSAAFGAIGLVLAAVGLFGVMSYAVNRRRAEIGIRMALGASPAGIVQLIAGRVAIMLALGLAAGVMLSVWLAPLAGALFFGVEPRSAGAIGGAAAVLVCVAALASVVPAVRAATVDPTKTLRA